MSSYSSPTPSSLFDRGQGTPSSVSTYNPNAPALVAVPLPHGQRSQGPALHYLLDSGSNKYHTFDTAFPLSYAKLASTINPAVYKDYAISASITRLRLRVSAVNLVVDVTNPHHGGVLVEDVFRMIFHCLQQPLSRDAYGSLPVPVREAVDKAWKHRLQTTTVNKIQGTTRELAFVDCLGEKSRFFSLSFARDGVWDVLLY
ncbi:hypothetical protein M378DRAFT_15061 [Amanita muscaria Koide BX008]|uniref:DUF6699 domain-containing protein n=1 Tax=Amanita muscaria (strain Koide BX008) TaxID=946122 RepID=A0A0C2WCT3_AMAMK|nr:hypothetical protein M378DRAFT_15061 [Amanita muscaria Koide BX008]